MGFNVAEKQTVVTSFFHVDCDINIEAIKKSNKISIVCFLHLNAAKADNILEI